MSTTMLEREQRTRRQVEAKPDRGWRSLFRTESDPMLTVLRVTLGAVMFPHAAQKVFGWFGGYGIEGTMGFLTGGMGLPVVVAALVIVFEMGGSIALITGALGRLGAVAIGVVMVGAMVTTHLQHGFFMNWSGAQAGEGFEYHLLALAMAAVIAVRGSGAFSVDRSLAR